MKISSFGYFVSVIFLFSVFGCIRSNSVSGENSFKIPETLGSGEREINFESKNLPLYSKRNLQTLMLGKNKIEIQKILIMLEIDKLNFSDYKDKKVILKGCSKLPEAEFALTYLTSKLQPIVSSLMFGEPCSTVPIFKRKK